MANAWITVQTTGKEQSLFRFFGYTIIAFVLANLFRRLLELSVSQTALIGGVLLIYPWASLASWMLSGTGESIASLVVLLSVSIGAYLLYGPISRVAADVGGKRQLIYRRLRNHAFLSMSVLVVMALLSEQTLGVLGSFTAAVGTAYVDIVYVFGVAILAYFSTGIFERDADHPDSARNFSRRLKQKVSRVGVQQFTFIPGPILCVHSLCVPVGLIDGSTFRCITVAPVQ